MVMNKSGLQNLEVRVNASCKRLSIFRFDPVTVAGRMSGVPTLDKSPAWIAS